MMMFLSNWQDLFLLKNSQAIQGEPARVDSPHLTIYDDIGQTVAALLSWIFEALYLQVKSVEGLYKLET